MNKPGLYTVKNVEPNDFINSKNKPEDLAKFGKTYSVAFDGDAETYLWTTKTPPETGKQYWGHIQSTSGRMMRFKLDKPEKSEHKDQYKDHSKDITLGLVYKTVVGVVGIAEGDKELSKLKNVIRDHTAMLFELSREFEDAPKLEPNRSPTGYNPHDDIPPLDAYDGEADYGS